MIHYNPQVYKINTRTIRIQNNKSSVATEEQEIERTLLPPPNPPSLLYQLQYKKYSENNPKSLVYISTSRLDMYQIKIYCVYCMTRKKQNNFSTVVCIFCRTRGIQNNPTSLQHLLQDYNRYKEQSNKSTLQDYCINWMARKIQNHFISLLYLLQGWGPGGYTGDTPIPGYILPERIRKFWSPHHVMKKIIPKLLSEISSLKTIKTCVGSCIFSLILAYFPKGWRHGHWPWPSAYGKGHGKHGGVKKWPVRWKRAWERVTVSESVPFFSNDLWETGRVPVCQSESVRVRHGSV